MVPSKPFRPKLDQPPLVVGCPGTLRRPGDCHRFASYRPETRSPKQTISVAVLRVTTTRARSARACRCGSSMTDQAARAVPNALRGPAKFRARYLLWARHSIRVRPSDRLDGWSRSRDLRGAGAVS